MTAKKNIRGTKIQRSYKTFVLLFGLGSLFLIGVIAYFSFSRTVIWVTPKTAADTLTARLEIQGSGQTPEANSAMPGIILAETVHHEYIYTDLPTVAEVPGTSHGTVTIHNRYSKAQPLVAGTRLLTADGLLFRTTTRVDVPVGGSVEAAVEADQKGKAYDVPPGRFTIPGLWLGLQDKIFGESAVAMTGGTQKTMVARLEDIETAKTAAEDAALATATLAISTKLNTIDAESNIIAQKKEILSETSSVEPGQQASDIRIIVDLRLTAVAAKSDAIQERALQTATQSYSENLEFVPGEEASWTCSLDTYQPVSNTALLKCEIAGTSKVKISHPMFSRADLVNRDRQDVMEYFAQFPEVERVDIHFSPFWAFRTPTLADHIDVRLR